MNDDEDTNLKECIDLDIDWLKKRTRGLDNRRKTSYIR
jgi:hypothetical protein